MLHYVWLRGSYDLIGVRFLSPGKKELPFIQENWRAKVRANAKVQQTDQSSERDEHVQVHLQKLQLFNTPRFVRFAAPFAEFLTAGWTYLNLEHPGVIVLVDCVKRVADRHAANLISEHDFGTIGDVLRPLFTLRHGGEEPVYLSTKEIAEKCLMIQRLLDLVSRLGVLEAAKPLFPSETLNVPYVVTDLPQGTPIQSLREVGLPEL